MAERIVKLRLRALFYLCSSLVLIWAFSSTPLAHAQKPAGGTTQTQLKAILNAMAKEQGINGLDVDQNIALLEAAGLRMSLMIKNIKQSGDELSKNRNTSEEYREALFQNEESLNLLNGALKHCNKLIQDLEVKKRSLGTAPNSK